MAEASPLPPDLEEDEHAAVLPSTPADGSGAATPSGTPSGSTDVGTGALLRLALPAMANQASRPLAALITVALVGHAPDEGDGSGSSGASSSSVDTLAAFSAVTAVVTFATIIFNFTLTVTWAQLGKVAIGEQRWPEVGPRVRIAAAVALVAGLSCAAGLLALRSTLWSAMALSPPIVALATPYYHWRLATIPLGFLHQTACGVLGGYHRLHCLTAINTSAALAEVASAALALFVWEGGLPMLGAASCATTACAAMVSWTAAAALPPEQAQGRIRLAPSCGRSAYYDLQEDSVEAEEQAAQGRGCREYLCGSADMMLRSGSLQVSIFAMALCAARLGPAPLAAHQITMSLCASTHLPSRRRRLTCCCVTRDPDILRLRWLC